MMRVPISFDGAARSLAVLLLLGGLPAPASAQLDAATTARVKSIRIVPEQAQVCPGRTIAATYLAVLDDGSMRRIDGLARLDRSGDAVHAEPGGGWTTALDPLISLPTGFRLHAALHGTPAVGDTVVVPDYRCEKRTLDLYGPLNGPDLTIRLSAFKTAFAPNLILASIEVHGRARPLNVVLDPRIDGREALTVRSLGAAGKKGQTGRPGTDAFNGCSNGEDGGEGAPGEPGGPGGNIVEVTQSDVGILQDFLNAMSLGGEGGAGGDGGPGGKPNITSTTGRRCVANYGRIGRAGAPGSTGPAGKMSLERHTIPDIWRDSMVAHDPELRAALVRLFELNGLTPNVGGA